jgi:hypothetical protein
MIMATTMMLTANFYDSNPLVQAEGTMMLTNIRHHSPTDIASLPEALNPQEQFCENLKPLSSNF